MCCWETRKATVTHADESEVTQWCIDTTFACDLFRQYDSLEELIVYPVLVALRQGLGRLDPTRTPASSRNCQEVVAPPHEIRICDIVMSWGMLATLCAAQLLAAVREIEWHRSLARIYYGIRPKFCTWVTDRGSTTRNLKLRVD